MRVHPVIHQQIHKNLGEAKEAGAEFMIADVELALTMLDFADVTHDPETARRNRQNATVAYETINRLLLRAALDPRQLHTVEARLEELARRLSLLPDPSQ